jgi:hypothetical protein
MTTHDKRVAELETEGTTNEECELTFWFALIEESPAARFIGVEPRTMQGYRQRGDGPPYIRLSFRCIRYRRIDLREWAEKRRRTSTSDVSANKIPATDHTDDPREGRSSPAPTEFRLKIGSRSRGPS